LHLGDLSLVRPLSFSPLEESDFPVLQPIYLLFEDLVFSLKLADLGEKDFVLTLKLNF
jgi:hypothetical protein